MAGEDQQRRAVTAGGTGASRPTDPTQEVGLDRTHPPEASIQHRTPGSPVEPAGAPEEESAEEQLEARHGGRAERDGHHLEGGREGGPEPCPMEDCRRWPMLLSEGWA